ncbi:MAG: cupin domain-containing protein [Chloroflexi bacterium]|nr:cupin domain-containing protein [Chloroflexota bacterium]
MPIEVRRFGVGYRRPEGPPGTRGLAGQVIHSDGRGLISELAFSRGGTIVPHDNPNTSWFCVIEGGGWVLVGEERRRVAAGEAVLWPANVTHAAWTEQGEMRAIVVEFAGPDDAHPLLEEAASTRRIARATRRIGAGESSATPDSRADSSDSVARGEGQLADRPVNPAMVDRSSGEPV